MHFSNKMGKQFFLIVLLVIAMSMLTWAAAPEARLAASSHATTTAASQARAMTYMLSRSYTSAELAAGSYVGSEFCLACHTGLNPEVLEFNKTLHAFFIRKPMAQHSMKPGMGVMANALGAAKDDFITGLDFNTLTGTAFDSLKPNAPILSYEADTDKYYIKLGPNGLKLQVAATLGGASVGNGQRYMVRIPVSNTPNGWSQAVYFGPVVWSGTAWTSNATNWYNGIDPKYAPGVATTELGPLQTQNYNKTCAGCHITGVRKAYQATTGEYVVNPFVAVLYDGNDPNYPDLDNDGQADLANIGCEACHGPGSNHIMLAGNPAMIVNPAKITNNRQRSDVCLQCHVQIGSAPNKIWGFSYNETANKPFMMTNPPDNLDNYQVFTGGKWPDGWNYVGARVDSYKGSGHYEGSHGIACNDCHNAHAETTNPAQVRDMITRGTNKDIPAHVENNSFCLSCHATHGPWANITQAQVKDWANNTAKIREVTEAHTHHADLAERTMGVSRCTTCHMAPTAGHGTIEGANHTFMPARPEDTVALQNAKGTGNTWGSTGNVNACSAACHRGRVQVWTNVPINPTPNDNKFGTANEVSLARYLAQYFGPDGLWWNTKAAAKSEKGNDW